jgi:hypothetical protein
MYFIEGIAEYIDVEGPACPIIGGLNNFIQNTVE